MKDPSLPVTCPHCHETALITCIGKRHALYPLAYAIFFPLYWSQSHQLQCPTDYLCQSCNRTFKRRTRIAKTVGIPLLILSIVSTLLYIFLTALNFPAHR